MIHHDVQNHPEDVRRGSTCSKRGDRLQRQEPDPPGRDAEAVDDEECDQADAQSQQDHRNSGSSGTNLTLLNRLLILELFICVS